MKFDQRHKPLLGVASQSSANRMGTAALSLDQAPPISVPLRFFLTAPLFGVVSSLALVALGPAVWASRWSAGALAVTHLMTLGFLTMVMIGALMQMLPVVAGAPVARVRMVGGIVHALLSFGTLALVGGFLSSSVLVMGLGLTLLALTFIAFIGAAVGSLAHAHAAAVTVRGMRFSVAAIGVTACLGLLLGVERAWHQPLAVRRLAALHLGWGLIGWVGLLVISVAFQVVPMFQTTPSYPRTVTNRLTPAIFIALLLWSSARWFSGHLPQFYDSAAALASLLGLGYALFAVTTLVLQRRRRREMPDITVWFWRIGMASLLACAALGWVAQWEPGNASTRLEFTWGTLAILGFGVSVINGMLYKIVPFLVWLHLQSSPVGRGKLPNMKEIIPDRHAFIQFWLHLAALLLLAGAVWIPHLLTYPAAATLGFSNLLLGLNLVSAWRLYTRILAGGFSG
ncbi:MAG: hypothetical protein ACYDHM_12940 [Acidiferrobacterales bacterium]